jgi:hypothetical protein
MQNRRVLVSYPGQFVQRPSRQVSEAVEMWFEPLKIGGLKVKLEKLSQTAIDGVEVLPGAIRGDMAWIAVGILDMAAAVARYRK